MTKSTALQLATASAVVGASGAAYLAYSSYAAKQTKDLVVLLDGSNKSLRLPRHGSVALLIASLEQELHIHTPRLFLLQVIGTKCLITCLYY
jgi:hypothetical protein